MAKVTQPLGSSEARGAVGGYVYNTWRGISTVRIRVTPKTLHSSAQTALRAKTAIATVGWKAASDDQRLQWELYSTQHPDIDWTGSKKRLTGYNWFVRLNVRRQLLGLSIVYTPPSSTFSFVPSHMYHSAAPHQIQMTWPNDTNPYGSNLYMEFYYAGPYSISRNPTINDAKRSGSTLFSNLAFNIDVPAIGYYTVFYRPVLSTGIVGAWQAISRQITSM